jgi:hypothetical protein
VHLVLACSSFWYLRPTQVHLRNILDYNNYKQAYKPNKVGHLLFKHFLHNVYLKYHGIFRLTRQLLNKQCGIINLVTNLKNNF